MVGFGDYVYVAQKRHCAPDEMYMHKVIGTIKSNFWMDVPAEQHVGMVIHAETETVVQCVTCGIGEDQVIRYRLQDVTKSTTHSPIRTI